ncbi:MAG: FAD-dependent oxidoreductase, partial [Actinomycetales bacterium]
MSQIVVIGAGVGGLAAAARLAAGGHQVSVFEQGDRTGGKLRTWQQDGFAFDTGPSLLTLPA